MNLTEEDLPLNKEMLAYFNGVESTLNDISKFLKTNDPLRSVQKLVDEIEGKKREIEVLKSLVDLKEWEGK